ncbi:hypothetical protein Sros01_04060 [Streptomyces roseochromogenus]|nr:hypothetical protein Sros01_04060 [Streptomyces roseochromogenus]
MQILRALRESSVRRHGGFTACSVRAPKSGGRRARAVVLGAGRVTYTAGTVDLLVQVPGDDVEVPLAVLARVTADEVLGGELGQVVLDADGAVVRAQGPQQPGEDCGLVPEASVVVGLGEQPEEGALGGEGDRGEGLGGEGLGLDGSDAGHGQRVPSTVACSSVVGRRTPLSRSRSYG